MIFGLPTHDTFLTIPPCLVSNPVLKYLPYENPYLQSHFTSPNSLSHLARFPPEDKNLYTEFVVKVLFADRPHKSLSGLLEISTIQHLLISDHSSRTSVLITLLRPNCHPILAYFATVICPLSQMAYTLGKAILNG
jgi:hypothetical protein